MTEAEWLTCDDAARMIAHLGGGASDRKLRLFAVACFRRWPGSHDEKYQGIAEVAEPPSPLKPADTDPANAEETPSGVIL